MKQAGAGRFVQLFAARKGGNVPLGYDVVGRLVVNEAEALGACRCVVAGRSPTILRY